jgi:hypothetical protein
MKSAFLLLTQVLALSAIVSAQDPATEARKRLMERNNTGNGTNVSPTTPGREVIISYITYLSAEREWSDISDRKMTGRLVAFQAPEPGKSGPMIVLKEGKILLRRTGTKANSEFPLDQLSETDQVFVKSIDAAIKKDAVPVVK